MRRCGPPASTSFSSLSPRESRSPSSTRDASAASGARRGEPRSHEQPRSGAAAVNRGQRRHTKALSLVHAHQQRWPSVDRRPCPSLCGRMAADPLSVSPICDLGPDFILAPPSAEEWAKTVVRLLSTLPLSALLLCALRSLLLRSPLRPLLCRPAEIFRMERRADFFLGAFD